ncbi:hypothetical protein D5086_026199 [Populus alba]|uniref:Uncharacterized protein n=1 Tax=Populus alba TaxID=43335 RepID=A0ACC4B1N8_POPAL
MWFSSPTGRLKDNLRSWIACKSDQKQVLLSIPPVFNSCKLHNSRLEGFGGSAVVAFLYRAAGLCCFLLSLWPVLLGNALLPDICPCLYFATWLQQRALLQLHYRVGKVLVIYDSLWKVEARFLSVSCTILDGISCVTLRDSCFVDRLLGVNPSLDVSGYMSNTSTIEKFLTSKSIFKRILKVLVSVHNLSATIRDLRVDYDVVI